jgi:hypothetical protein
LFLFKPFGLNLYHGNILLLSFGFGFTTFIILLGFFKIAYPLFPLFFREDGWTIKREILSTFIILSLIGLGNGIYAALYGITKFDIENILWFELFTLLIGIFPVVAIVLFKENQLSEKYQGESESLNKIIDNETKRITKVETKVIEEPSVKIKIRSESGKEDLELEAGLFLFMRGADNYAEIYFFEGPKIIKKVIRTSLKLVEQTVGNKKECYRCHKSYLVNLNKVVHISGNAQGYKLHLKEVEDLIPVSRKLNQEIKNLLVENG